MRLGVWSVLGKKGRDIGSISQEEFKQYCSKWLEQPWITLLLIFLTILCTHCSTALLQVRQYHCFPIQYLRTPFFQLRI